MFRTWQDEQVELYTVTLHTGKRFVLTAWSTGYQDGIAMYVEYKRARFSSIQAISSVINKALIVRVDTDTLEVADAVKAELAQHGCRTT